MIITYKVEMYMKGQISFAIYSPLMMAQDRPESTRVTISYGSFINQLPPETVMILLFDNWKGHIEKYIEKHIYIV